MIERTVFFVQNILLFQRKDLSLHQLLMWIMRRNLTILVMMTMLAIPSMAEPFLLERTASEQVDDRVTVTVEGGAVMVCGAQGKVLEVISLTGRQVAQFRIDSPAQRVELNLSKGCYVLKVGKLVRKVSIR